MSTRLGFWLGGPVTDAGEIPAKTAEGLPPYGTRIGDFDTWREGYAGASVLVIRAGTTEHAPLYSDPTLSVPIDNPVVLLSYTDVNGSRYGKWPTAVYTYVPYRMTINETGVTGVERPPLYDITGVDLSRGLIASTRGAYTETLAEFADREIYAEAFGSLAASQGSASVTAVINSAIGAAASQGGGTVRLPAGNIIFTTLTLPEGVVLEGQGLSATTLISTTASAVITLSGDGAGLRNLTLDGVNVSTGSVGVYAVGLVGLVFHNVLIKRFADGLYLRGASYCQWFNLTLSSCVRGGQLRGDTDASASGNGGEVRGITWIGGGWNLCTTSGLTLTFIDDFVDGVTLDGVAVTDNLGESLLLNGVRNINVRNPQFTTAEAQTALKLQDDTNLARVDDNTIDHITFEGGVYNGGILAFNGSCASVAFLRADLRGNSFDLTVPTEIILLQDCIEDAEVTATGDLTKLLRSTSAADAEITGFTTDATATTAWSYALEPGAVALFQAEIVAQRQDGEDWGILWIAAGFQRPGSTLDFSGQTANFTAGSILTGATSGATARIITQTDAGTTGTLTLGDITGTFTLGEIIADADGGSATVAGSLTPQNVAIDGVGSTAVRASAASGGTTYPAEWDASGSTVRLRLTGMSGHLVQWTCRIRRVET